MDQGGPRREFFRLLATKAQVYLKGFPGWKFFDTNVSAVQVCVFFKFLSFESVTITETLSLFQGQDLFNLGRYIAMSICQGGCGFPFLAQPVYTYLCTGKITEVVLASSDAPDPVLQLICATKGQ